MHKTMDNISSYLLLLFFYSSLKWGNDVLMKPARHQDIKEERIAINV